MTPLTPYLVYIKLGAAAVLLAIATGAGYHFGGLSGSVKAADAQTALERDHASMAQAATTALLAQAAQAAADHASQQKVIDAYDATKDIPDPASIGTAHRVLLVAAAGGGCAVPETGTVAGGAAGPAPIAIGPSEVERRLNDYIQACGGDAKRLTAAQALASR